MLENMFSNAFTKEQISHMMSRAQVLEKINTLDAFQGYKVKLTCGPLGSGSKTVHLNWISPVLGGGQQLLYFVYN